MVHPSLITVLSLGASRSLAFTLNQEQYNILQRKYCRKLFSSKGCVFSKPSVHFEEVVLLLGEICISDSD